MRRLLLSGAFGPGQRFRWQGRNWEIVQVVDQQGSTQEFNAQSLVIVTPSTGSPDFDLRPEAILADLGEELEAGQIGARPPTTVGEAVVASPTAAPPGGEAPSAEVERLLNVTSAGTAAGATEAGLVGGRTLQENRALCLSGEPGWEEGCSNANLQEMALGSGAGPGGFSFEEQLGLLLPELQATAAARAQGVSETIASGLTEALGAIGLAAPQIFLASAQDPAAMQQALVEALQEGRGVFPTMERQQLIAEAAQSPTDVVRLLFLAGGRTPPARRTGAFNVASVLEQGGRAREDLARQIAGMPQLTFDDLAQRFTPPMPPVGAEHGAIVQMLLHPDGVYRAAGGATVVEGPELFTVGEGGKTEFALLAPGSVIAPKLSADEDESRETAARAVTEMLLFGKRQPAKAQERARKADDGALIPEADQALVSLANLLQGARGVGASLGGPARGPSERMRDMRLQLFPFPETSEEQRRTAFVAAARDPLIAKVLGLTVPEGVRPEESRELTQRFGEQRAFLEDLMKRMSMGELPTSRDAQAALALRGGEFGPAADAILGWAAGNIGPEELQTELSALLPTGETRTQAEDLLRVQQATREGGGAAGTRLPMAEIMAQPATVRAEQLTILGSLFGSDLITDLVDLFQEGKRQAFASGEARLLV